MRFGIATAPHYSSPRYDRSPRSKLFDFAVEDAFAWRDGDSYHAIFKDQSGALGGEADGGVHAISADGATWGLADPPPAYSRRATYGDEEVDLTYRERTQLLFDAKGTPTHLFNAVLEGDRGGHTWNMVTPLGPDS